MNTEELYVALFASLAPAAGFITKSRRLKHWNDVPQTSQPAMFMAQEDMPVSTSDSGLPSRYELHVMLYVYARIDNDAVPGTIINPLIDALVNIINARNPINGRNQLQLSNVAYCRVEGTVQIDEGTLDNQAVATIPVVIFVTY